MSDRKMPKLIPCPRCGQTPALVRTSFYRGNNAFVVGCFNCYFAKTMLFFSKREAAMAWNVNVAAERR